MWDLSADEMLKMRSRWGRGPALSNCAASDNEVTRAKGVFSAVEHSRTVRRGREGCHRLFVMERGIL